MRSAARWPRSAAPRPRRAATARRPRVGTCRLVATCRISHPARASSALLQQPVPFTPRLQFYQSLGKAVAAINLMGTPPLPQNYAESGRGKRKADSSGAPSAKRSKDVAA